MRVRGRHKNRPKRELEFHLETAQIAQPSRSPRLRETDALTTAPVDCEARGNRARGTKTNQTAPARRRNKSSISHGRGRPPTSLSPMPLCEFRVNRRFGSSGSRQPRPLCHASLTGPAARGAKSGGRTFTPRGIPDNLGVRFVTDSRCPSAAQPSGGRNTIMAKPHRTLKKANHGRRPANSKARRLKRKDIRT